MSISSLLTNISPLVDSKFDILKSGSSLSVMIPGGGAKYYPRMDKNEDDTQMTLVWWWKT